MNKISLVSHTYQDRMKRLADISMKWVGVPYVHKGVTKAGCDCVGLLIGVLLECGVFTLPLQLFDYSASWMLAKDSEELLLKYLPQYVVPCELVPGSFLFFKMGRYVCHAGIYVGNNEFVHCVANVGVVKDNLDNQMRSRIYLVARLKDELLEKINL